MLLYIYGLCISSLDQVVQLPTTEEDKALSFIFLSFLSKLKWEVFGGWG